MTTWYDVYALEQRLVAAEAQTTQLAAETVQLRKLLQAHQLNCSRLAKDWRWRAEALGYLSHAEGPAERVAFLTCADELDAPLRAAPDSGHTQVLAHLDHLEARLDHVLAGLPKRGYALFAAGFHLGQKLSQALDDEQLRRHYSLHLETVALNEAQEGR